MQRRSIQMCAQAFCFLSGSVGAVHQCGSQQASSAAGLQDVGLGLQGGECSALLNHHTNVFYSSLEQCN